MWMGCVAWLSMMGCGPGLIETQEDGLRWLSGVIRSSNSGTARLPVKPLDTETHMLMTASVLDAGQKTHLQRLETPERDTVFEAVDEARSSQSHTNAGFLGTVVSMAWPILDSDPPLSPQKWRYEIGVATAGGTYLRDEVAVDVILKQDSDPSGGSLDVAIVFAGDAAVDEALVDGTRVAVEVWRELYASIGIVLEVIELEYPTGELTAPGGASDEHFSAIASQTSLSTVNVVIVPAIQGVEDVYGLAGDIPGPLVPSGRSAVLVSGEYAMGVDGAFSEEELRIYGETLAHETGHLLGLFHPVESEYDQWDALGDTVECATEGACIEALGRNLMFPFPVCDFISCSPQDELSGQQAAQANRYVAVD